MVMKVDIRRNEDGTLDELHASTPQHVHLEQMRATEWCLIVDETPTRQVHVFLSARTTISAHVMENL